MTMTVSRKILRWISPGDEKRRVDFRMFLNQTMANAEDTTRIVKSMNGALHKKLEEYIKVK